MPASLLSPLTGLWPSYVLCPSFNRACLSLVLGIFVISLLCNVIFQRFVAQITGDLSQSAPHLIASKKWIDIRKIFSNKYGVRGGITTMLDTLGLRFEVNFVWIFSQSTYMTTLLLFFFSGFLSSKGRQHCGLDDARNIARIVARVPMLCCPSNLRRC